MSAAILATRDSTELSRMLELWLARFGVRGFSFAQSRRVGSAFVDETLLSSWPADILFEFTADGLYHHDPVLKRFMRAVESFAWDVSIYSESDPNELRLRQIRARCGVTGGVVAVVCSSLQTRFRLCASGSEMDRSQAMCDALTNVAAMLAARICAFAQAERVPVHQPQIETAIPLTRREREVIRWVAAGKSSRETAMILSLSEHTVNDYIASAVGKLKVSNRTQAVVRALLLEQIEM